MILSSSICAHEIYHFHMNFKKTIFALRMCIISKKKLLIRVLREFTRVLKKTIILPESFRGHEEALASASCHLPQSPSHTPFFPSGGSVNGLAVTF